MMGTTSTQAEMDAFKKVLKQATEYQNSTGKKMTEKQVSDAMKLHLSNPNLGVATSQKQTSTPNIKGQTNQYGQTYLGNNKFTGQGYAYVDKYGYSHVVKDYDNALNASADGKVYSYQGDYSGGYAYDNQGYRVPLNIEGSKPYGNDVALGRGYSSVPTDGVYSPLNGNGKTLNADFSGQIGGLATIPAPLVKPQETAGIIPAALNSGNTIIPASTEQAGYQQSPKWVGNVYPGATWNADTRTITTKNGDTLVENVDFAINPEDNRAYVIEKQTGVNGGTSAGTYPQGGQTGFATDDPVGQIYQMIMNMQNNRGEAPTYEQPDYSDLIPKPTKGVAITANAGDTVFTPTVRYNDRVEQIKARADSNAWNQYQSQYNAYQNDRNAEQQMLSNLSSLLPYSTLTYAQQLDQQAQQAAAEQEAIVAMYEQAMDMWKVLGYVPQGLEEILGVPAGTPTSDYSYKQATLALNQYKASKSGSGGSSGATKEPKSTQSELTGALMSAMGHYKTPADYLADLQRNKPQIIALVGTSNYNYLYNDAQAAVDAGNAVNPKFVPGTASPIRAMLESI
mgnify:CR=1 FL=1